jgi:hypothetical protein
LKSSGKKLGNKTITLGIFLGNQKPYQNFEKIQNPKVEKLKNIIFYQE